MDKTATDFTTLSFESAVQETLSQGAGGISTFAVLLAAFSVLFLSYLSTRNKWDIRGKDEKKEKPKGLDSIAGPKRLPLIGNLLDIKYNVEEMDDFFLETAAKYPKRARFNVLGENFIIIYNAEDMKEILHTKQYIQKSAEYDVFTWIGKGVLTADENLWMKTRPVLDKGFRHQMLNKYRDVFCNKTRQLMDVLKDRVAKHPDEAFNIFPLIFDTGFDIISESVMNTPSNVLGGVDKNVYSPNMDRAADFFHYLHFRPFFYKTTLGRFLWRHSKDGKEEAECLKTLNDFSQNLMQNRKRALAQEPDQDSQNATSLLDIMLLEQKTNPRWTDRQIRDEIDTFLTGGHGATTATFGMFIQLMGAHPDIQEKVYQEVSAVFDGDSQRELTLDDLNKLKYTELCIKECLRLYPGVPIFPRAVLRPLTLSDGTVVPVNTTLLLIPFLLHRDPETFPDPEKFIPERFEVGHSDRHPYSWIPFSKGPRDCIGKAFSMIEMKVYVAYLMNNFKVVKAVNTEDMTVLLRIFLKSKTGIQIKLEPRY